ncbi:DUF397 domain-containing protein [Actinoallomurus soli]
MNTSQSNTTWRTSSYSGNQGGTCVQVAALWSTSRYSGEPAM